MKRFGRNIIQLVFSLTLAAVFLVLAFRGKDLGQLVDSLIAVPWWWFVILFIGTILSHLIRAWRWKYLLTPVKSSITLRNAFSVVMIGYLINNLIPRFGELIRPYAMGKLEHVSKSATMGTIVLERILDLVAFALVVLAALLLYSRPFLVWFPRLADTEWMFFAGAFLMFVVFLLMFLKADVFFRLFRGLVTYLPKRWRPEGERIFESFISGFQAAKHPGNFFMIGVTSTLVWISYIVLLYIPFFIYGFTADYGMDLGSATVLQVASGIAFALPTPSGIGSYYLLTSFTLTTIYHVDAVTALSYSVYTHTVGLIATTVVGLYYFFRDRIHVADVMRREGTDDGSN